MKCVKCGEDKEVKGGKFCEKDHFVCKRCTYTQSVWGFGEERTRCPVCDKRLK